MSVVPINVGRPRSVRLVEELAGKERALVGVLAQRSPDTVEPTFGEVHSVGTLARVVKVIRLGQSNYSVVLNGLSRFELMSPLGLEPFMQAQVRRIRERRAASQEVLSQAQELREGMRRVLELTPDLPKDTAGILDNVREPGALADLIASNLSEEQATLEERQGILEAFEVNDRVSKVLTLVRRQLDVLSARAAIAQEIQAEMSGSQREYVLREQMRTILEELGEAGEEDDIDTLRGKIMRAELPKGALEVAKKQLSRLRAMQPQAGGGGGGGAANIGAGGGGGAAAAALEASTAPGGGGAIFVAGAAPGALEATPNCSRIRLLT
jgi:ATP-dependent Lon protease